ncbi:MAG TPA: NifU family protein [Cytophagaceae bacterium]
METNKRPIEIYTESNPNPNTLKFVADIILLPEGTVEYTNPAEAQNCPLALDLFRFNFVKRIFITANFITITKAEDIDWYEISPMIRALIKSSLEEGKPLFLEKPEIKQEAIDPNEPEVVSRIKVVLDDYVKPAVEQDGGAINFKSFVDGVVQVELQGSCSGCPSSTVTLKAGIENLLKRMVPEVKEVVAVS